MSKLAGKLAGRVLKVFLKSYNAHHLSVELMDGDATLRGAELDCDVLSSLLRLPPNIAVRAASCGFLRVHVPWRRLRSEAVRLSVEVLSAELAEVDAAAQSGSRPMPPQLAKLLGADKKKRRAKTRQRQSAVPGFVASAIEGLSVDVKGVFLGVTLRGQQLPKLALKLDSLSLCSTNSRWEPVPLAAAAAEGRRNGEVVVWKELRLGTLTLELGKGLEVLRLQPSTTHITLRRTATAVIPSEINIDAVLAGITLDFGSGRWEHALAAVEDVLWMVDAAKKFASRQAADAEKQTAATPAPQMSVPTPAATPASEASSDSASELADDFDFAALSRELELGSDSSSAASSELDRDSTLAAPGGQQQTPDSQSLFPTIQFSVNLMRTHVQWPGIAAIALNNTMVSSSLERIPVLDIPQQQQPSAGTTAKHRHITNSLLRCSVGALGFSSNPTGWPLDRDPSISFFLGEHGMPFVDASFGTRRAPNGTQISGPGTEISVDIAKFRFVPEPSHLRRMLSFFLGHRIRTPPSKSNIAEKIRWLDSSRCHINAAGLTVDMQIAPGGPRVCAHVGPVTVDISPSPLSPLAAFPPAQSASSELGFSADGEPKALHALLRCGVSVYNIWAGLCDADPASEPFYFFSPFHAEGELQLFQAVAILEYALGKKQSVEVDRRSFSKPEEMPAIHGAVHITPITFSLAQSKLHSARSTLRIATDMLRGREKEVKEEEDEEEHADADAEETATKSSSLQRRLQKLRRAINAKLAERIPCRAHIEIALAKTGIAVSCSQAAVKEAVDLLWAGALNKITTETFSGIGAALLLRQPQEDAELEEEFVFASFEELEGTIVYSPPPLPSLSALISAEIQQQQQQQQQQQPQLSDSCPLVTASFAFKGYKIRLNTTEQLQIGALVEPLSRPQQRRDDAACLTVEELISEDDMRPPGHARVVYALAAEGKFSQHHITASLAGVNVTASGIPPARIRDLILALKRQWTRRSAERKVAALRRQKMTMEDPGAAATIVRLFGKKRILLDLELSDMDVHHTLLLGNDTVLTVAKLVPQTSEVVQILRRRVEARLSASAREAEALEKTLQQATAELQSTVQALVELKMEHAMGESQRQEQLHEATVLRKAVEAAAKKSEKLRAENERLYNALDSRFSDLAVKEFRAVIADLADADARLTMERDSLTHEAARLKAVAIAARVDADAFQLQISAMEEEARRDKAEIVALREDAASAQLHRKELEDRVRRQEEELSRLRQQVETLSRSQQPPTPSPAADGPPPLRPLHPVPRAQLPPVPPPPSAPSRSSSGASKHSKLFGRKHTHKKGSADSLAEAASRGNEQKEKES